MKILKKNQLKDYTDNNIISGISLPHIEIEKNSCVTVEGVKSILEYDEGTVRIDCGDIVVKFTGDRLEIYSMQSDRIDICGNFLSVEFFT